MRAAYFHCIGGLSGDMVLGALVDAGLPLESLTEELSGLGIGGYRIREEEGQRGGLRGTRIEVVLDEAPNPQHRSLGDILALISPSSLPSRVKERAEGVFHRLAQAEAKVHRTSIEEVRFHEVGATDAIVDVVGCAIGLELLEVDEVYCSPIPGGGGTVSSAHGTLPVPAPATLELMAMAHAPLRATSPPTTPGVELATPTGVAIMTALASFHQPTICLERTGYGLGSRDLGDYPNALGLWIGQLPEAEDTHELLLLETNIDDMNPELYGYVMERLFQAGAKDVWFTPIQMKKDRPAVMLSLLAPPQGEVALVETLLRETSSLGVRVRHLRRHEAEREVKEFASSLGPVRVKVKRVSGRAVSVSPEYDDCRCLALEKGLPLQEVYRIVTSEAGQRFLISPQ
ncbi:MAG: nickel pincer cofactor biosynthesis protein LarC [Dehalococcoidia bacterium]